MKENTNKVPQWIAVIIVLTVLLTATGIGIWQYEAKKEYIDGNVLNLPYINQWNDDNRLDNPWNNGKFYLGLMYRNLFLADSSFQSVTCDLAENYQVSSDGLSYTIQLKDGVLWSDGESLTIDDVVFSIQSVLRSTTSNAIYTTALSKIEGYDAFKANPSVGLSGLEVVNDNTLIIRLKSTHPTMLQVLAQLAILPAHCFQDSDIVNMDTDPYWKRPVVSGMYQVGEVVSGETVQLVRNPNYGETAPLIDEVMLHINYRFANLDYYSTNNITEIINYRAMRSMNEHKVDILFYRYFVFNVQGVDDELTSAMDDVNVRKAIGMAIDRESLLYDIYLDSGSIVDSGVPRSNPSYNGVELTYDPQQAKELLAASDYDMSRPLRLAYYYTDTTSKAFLEAVAKDLEAVGFTVEIYYASTSVELYEERQYDLLLKGLSAFDISEWYMEYDNENGNMARLMGEDTGFDPLVEELTITVDAQQKDTLLRDLQEMEQENMYKFPLFTLSQVLYINEDRVDLPPNCSFGNTWYKYDVDYEYWSIRKE